MKILLAIDGSSCSDRAVEEVALAAWPVGSEVRVISVVKHYAPLISGSSVPPIKYYEEIEMAERQQTHEVVERAAAKILTGEAAASALKVTTRVLSGSPKRIIIEEAERWGADLIVVGSHGSQSWERMLLGSVSQAVAMHAACSVQIARHCQTMQE